MKKREELGLGADHCALAIFDVFKGPDAILSLPEENNILYVTVPSNCTDRLQPLDESVNKSAKEFMKSKFQEWYMAALFVHNWRMALQSLLTCD